MKVEIRGDKMAVEMMKRGMELKKKQRGRPRKLVVGKLPKEQYEIAKKKQQDRIDELEQDGRYQEKMDTNLLNEYDFDYQGKKQMAEKRQKAMQ